MHQKQVVKITLIIIAITAITSVAAYLSYLNHIKVNESQIPSTHDTSTPKMPAPSLKERFPQHQPLDGKIDTSNWKTYRNEKYGFEFKHPPQWKIIDLEVDKQYHVSSVLFEAIIDTDNHPLNRAGHIFLINKQFEDILEEFDEDDPRPTDIIDFSSTNLSGKRFQLIYPKEVNEPQQIDYDFVFKFNNYTILILFSSFETSERFITQTMLEGIDTFAKSFSKIY